MSASTIFRVHARQVLDSRGRPTVEAEVVCEGGAFGRAIAPSGASTGSHEAVELRDRDRAHFAGKGVRKAVTNVVELIAPRLCGQSILDQKILDWTMIELDGTPNRSRLGANAMLAVSLACAHAAAACRGVPLWRHLDPEDRARLPLPMVNLISGGLHAGGHLDVQDFLLLPIGARSYSEALEMAIAVHGALGKVLTRNGFDGVLVGDEGGYGPRLQSNEQAIDLILEACEDVGLEPGKQAALAVDVAANQLYKEGKYHFRTGPGATLSSSEMIGRLLKWTVVYPVLSIEDGLAEDDWDGWRELTRSLGKRVQLIGDDLFVTNRERLAKGIQQGVANAVLVKPNQIGTLTETLEVVHMARQAGYRAVLSARSGETEDTTLAGLAVATGVGQIKIGSVVRGERLAKYNQLLRIEEEMGPNAPFASWQNVPSQAVS
jgi:enolase